MTTHIIKPFLYLCLGSVVSLSCLSAQAQNNAGSGRISRGTGTNDAYHTFIITLDSELGVTNAPSNPVSSAMLALSVTNLYHIDGTNTLEQTNTLHRIKITNTVAAFGSRYGGSPLYPNQDYHFGGYAGDSTGANGASAIMVSWNDRNSGAFGSLIVSNVPTTGNGLWSNFVANGMSVTIPSTAVPGLTTIWTPVHEGAWGSPYFGGAVFTEVADPSATNYEYTVWLRGLASATNWMVISDASLGTWSPLYNLDFDPRPASQPAFVSQPQFQGKPLPPAYLGKSLSELLTNQTVVNNPVGSSATNCLSLDDSPELRDSPILDQFVTDMGSNALALTSYVFNQIQLCDAVAYNSNTNNLLDTAINLGGVNRSALGTYMEGQGSPTEQCALLVYLLRRAGVPACYVFGPTDGIQMLDTQLSSLLRMQIHGIVNQNTGNAYTTNTLISVNYPWVAAYINGAWVHLFPWLKNTEVVEGLNLYDYMPTNYNSGASWVYQYLSGDPNIFSLSTETDVPSTLFPLFLQNALLTNAPGISLDDIGTTAIDRQVEYNQWSDFPTPFIVTNGAVTTVTNLTTITNYAGFAAWTNIWDTINVRVFSTVNTNRSLSTGDLRMCDLQDRKFLIRQQTNGASNFTLTLSLAPYRPALTNVMNFTNDAALLHQETMTLTSLTTNDSTIEVKYTRKRHRLEPSGATNLNYTASYGGLNEVLQPTASSSLRLGDLAAICLHSGKVSKQMLLPWAQEYWNMQQEVAANPSLTNTLSPDITQGTLPYLMGMSYYERCARFQGQLATLHKVHPGTVIGQGLSILGAQYNTNGTLKKPIKLYHPHVDMTEIVVNLFGNASLRPDEGGNPAQMQDAFNRLYITEGSAQEHKVIEDFYGQAGGISSVRLLLQAQKSGQPGMAVLNSGNYTSFSSLSNYDANIWSSVVNAFTNNNGSYSVVFITQKPVTNTTVGYTGMGALIYGGTFEAALISGNTQPANGGWGDPLSFPIYNPPDYNNISLSFNTSDNNNWSVGYFDPSVSIAPLSETVSTWDFSSTYGGLSSGAITYGGGDVAQQNAFDVAAFNLGYTGTGAPAASYADAANFGGDYDSHVGDEYAQLASSVADPVNAVTGEFYIDSTDLSLPGPMPLVIRRNYSSQNVDLGDSPFGYGWRPAYTPYLRIVTNNVIYAAEMDGTVVAYRQPIAGTNYWKPTAADNPQLNNRSSRGIGSIANLFNNYITTNVSGGHTNFFLNGADGSVRLFWIATYPLPGTNNISRTRPYLQTWTDVNGNSYSFTYQSDNTQPDYGQLLRVQSSNGNFLGFYYDAFTHITQAYTEDGRRLTYDYDSHGDLVTVTFPDESQINYTYQHSTVVTNSTTNIVSTHLISQEQKPDGRTLANTYDSLRRVLTQAATVGSDLSLVTNATFSYSNSFTNLTNTVITGTTAILDVFGHTNTYAYTSNQITSITDQLGQTITQVWFTNSGDTGYYPHSLKSQTDKRNLNTAYQYDSSGNLAQVVLTGNLTGGTATNETATYSFTYNAKNLISTASNPSANQVTFTYSDGSHPMLPTSITKLASGTPVSTNVCVYTNVSQVVTNGAVLWTNSAFGLLQEVIRGSTASNTFLYDGRGFLVQATRYTGTSDPAVTATYFYDDRGELAQRTDAAGRSLMFAYDDLGRMTGEEAFESGAATPAGWNFLYYSANGDLVWTDGSRYNPEDYVWRDYDGAGRKITEMRWRSEAITNGSGVQTPLAMSNLYATTFYQYDTFNNLVKVTDPLGNFTTNQYDAIGQLTREVAYSAAGTALSTNLFAYEPGGKVRQATNALGGVTSKGYTWAGKLMAQTNVDGSTNGWQYYLDGRLHKEFLPNGNYWETIYDDAHLKVSRYFHNGGTFLATNVVVMDARGNVIQNTDPNGNVSTNLYDGLDRIKVAAGPAIVTVANVGISFPLTNFVTNVLQQVSTYIYDSSGQTLTISNAMGEKTVTTSDALGRPTQVAIYNSNGVTPVRITSTAYSADHQSVWVTNGTGANAIVTTTYTDNDGHPLLRIGYPTTGVTEFTWWQYDLAGNCLAMQQCSSNSSGITVWATNGWTYDGLNRVAAETGKDGATTTYGLDAVGDVTNRTMSGVLTWSATYYSDGRIATEQEKGGSLTTRSMTYTYYAAGNPYAGMLNTLTDGRGTTWTDTYDDFFRVASVTTTGSLDQQKTTTTYHYDARGSLTNLAQSFNSSLTGPATSLTRAYNAYGYISTENLSVAGVTLSTIGQGFDAAGRRSQLAGGTFSGIPFNYQADGLMIAADGSTFGYANNGLLTGRTNSSRNYTVSQRDGRGRILSTTTSAGLTTPLAETLLWRGDGRLTNYLAQRGDFNDQRYYTYAPYSQRLTQEVFNVGTSQVVTNNYAVDNGSAGGLGVLTSSAQSGTQSDTWSVPSSTGLDGVSRVIQSQNTLITRPAYGTAKGAGSVSATLDGNPVSVQFDGPDGEGTWRASLALFPGSHTLSAKAVDPSGTITATTNSSFTANGGATDTVTNLYDGNGNVTQRFWISSSGVTNKIETLTWDAFNRLINVTDRDASNNGFNLVSIYDGLGRRIRTIQTLVTNGVAITSPVTAVSTVDSWYDPQVEFLEIGVNVNGQFTSKVYGPDANGVYGGMQGAGGLETCYITGHNNSYRSVQDYFGNVLGTITNNNSTVAWNPARFSSYGPVPGYQPPSLSANTTVAQTLGWRGKRIDPTGNYYFGGRSEYDPIAGRFTSADPLGHGASKDLYSLCDGDPVNKWDADGRFGKQMANDYQNLVDNLNEARQIADSQITYADSDFQYSDVDQVNAEKWSALVNMVPGANVIKGFWEIDTGRDMFTGEHLQGNIYLQAVGVVLNTLPAAFGPAALLEGGGEAAFFGAGEAGLMEVGGSETLAAADSIVMVDAGQGEINAARATFGTQQEFGFVQNDLSGQLSAWNTADGSLRDRVLANIAANQAATSGGISQGLITMDLRALTTINAQEVDAAGVTLFSPAQQNALKNNPGLFGAYRGSTIDSLVRADVKDDPFLNWLQGRSNKGADFIDPTSGQWWDMTTPAQWPAHLNKYGPGGILLPTK